MVLDLSELLELELLRAYFFTVFPSSSGISPEKSIIEDGFYSRCKERHCPSVRKCLLVLANLDSFSSFVLPKKGIAFALFGLLENLKISLS